MNITRKQLREFGTSEYLAKQLTRGLQPAGRQGRAYVYDVELVLTAIRDRLNAPRLRKATKTVLIQLEIEVSGLIEEPELNQQLLDAIAEAAQANTRFEQTARQSRKAAQELDAYKNRRGSHLSTHNNIVAFRA
jgi:hypothetical protein